MTGGEFEIQIEGKGKFKKSYLVAHESFARSLYKYAKVHGITPRCLCQTDGLAMHIAHYEKGDKYVLKRNSSTRTKHHPECSSFDEQVKMVLPNDYIEAITNRKDGSSNIKINVPLKFPSNVKTPQTGSSTPTSSKRQNKATTLRGLFDYLWELTGLLNGERLKYPDIRHAIKKNLLGNISCNYEPLSEILYMPDSESSSTIRSMIEDKCLYTKETGAKKRIIVLGLINKFENYPNRKSIRLYTIEKNFFFDIPKQSLVRHLRRRLKCKDKNYSYDPKYEGYFWFIGTAFPELKDGRTYSQILMDEGIVIPCSSAHVPL